MIHPGMAVKFTDTARSIDLPTPDKGCLWPGFYVSRQAAQLPKRAEVFQQPACILYNANALGVRKHTKLFPLIPTAPKPIPAALNIIHQLLRWSQLKYVDYGYPLRSSSIPVQLAIH